MEPINAGWQDRREEGIVATYIGTTVIPTSDTVLSGTTACPITGYSRFITLTTPAMEDTDSTLFEVVDSAGGTIISSGTKAESSVITFGTQAPLTKDMEFRVTAEGTQSAAGTITYNIHYQR